MVATKAFEVSNSSKLRTFAKKYERPAPDIASQAPQPAPRNDIFARMDLPSNIRKTNSLSQVIDVVPDVRYIFLFIVYNVGKIYPSLEQNARPLLTPSSLVAYCLYLVYGFMLVNDYQGRPVPSFFAHDFMDSRNRQSIYQTLLRCYVPAFLMPVFHAIADTSDPRRTGLEYFPTLAASIFDIDFGRLLPPQIFLHAHNMSTENDTSRRPSDAIEGLLSWNVFLRNAAADDIYVSQYFSSATQSGSYHSWLYQTLNLLFSPVTGKSILRRSNIQEIPCLPIHISSDHSDDTLVCNPYIMFLNADVDNAFQSNKFLKEFSAIVKSDLSGNFQLGAVPDDLSGLAILNHSYSIYALPTWHNEAFSRTHVHTSITSSDYATRIRYLQAQSYSKQSIVEPIKDFANAVKAMFLQISPKPHDPDDEPKSEQVILFDEDIHEHPNTLHLLPYEEGDGPVAYAMIGGLKIESFEVDGASVPQPNPEEKLADNNQQYAQGAIPVSHVLKGLGTPDETTVAPLPRAKLRALLQQVSIDLYDLSTNRLGYVDGDVEDAAVPTAMPGFNAVEHIRGFRRMYSKISFKVGTAPSIGTRRLAIWSPYRIINKERHKAPTAAQVHMLFNFRAMYGTHVPLVETDAYSTVIPTS